MPERWVVLPADATSGDQLNYSQILAVHAALLPNGQVLFFGGSQHIYDATLRSIDDPRLDNTRIWDPATGTVTRIPSPQPLYDLFCCGHTLLANGQLLVVGGTSGYPPADSDDHHAHYRGSRRTSRFNVHAPAGNPWLPTPDLATYLEFNAPGGSLNPDLTSGSGGRWYPMVVALGDRNVVAFGGHPEEDDNRHSNYSIEVYASGAGSNGTWVSVGDEPADVINAIARLRIPEVFPRAHLLPNGRVFLACLADGSSYSWDPYHRSAVAVGGWQRISAFPAGQTSDPISWGTTYFDNGRGDYSRTFFAWSSVLLPLLPEEDYAARVLIVGRAQPFIISLGKPTDPWPPSNANWQPTTARDTSNPQLFMPSPHRPSPVPETEFPGRGDPSGTRWTNLPGMRQQCFALLLPDETVLVIGGSTTHPSDWSGYWFDGVQLPEVYSPAQGNWTTLQTPATVPRVYHGVALLLPDGRVWTAGSNPFGDGQRQDFEHRIEVFEPWYFSEPRPVITNSPASVRHGQSFDVITPGAAVIQRVGIIRVGSVTHGFNFDQRYVGLRFELVAPDRVRVTAPPDGFIAPPGYYLLFVSNNRHVPSVAKFIHLDLTWEPWFALGPNTFPLGSDVAAVSSQPGGTSLFVTGLDEGHGGGRVWTNSFPDRDHPDQWVGWRPLGDNVFRPGSPVTALSLAPGATSLYLMGLDGQIWGNFFPQGGQSWSGWFGLGPNTFPLGSRVAAVSTQPGGTSLFVVGLDEGHGGGRVWTNSFPDPRHPKQGMGWRPLGDNVFRPGSPVTALSLAPGATSLYLTGLDGQIWSNFFPQGGQSWSGWFALGPNTFPLGSEVAAVSTKPGGTSLHLIGLDSQVWSTSFSP